MACTRFHQFAGLRTQKEWQLQLQIVSSIFLMRTESDRTSSQQDPLTRITKAISLDQWHSHQTTKSLPLLNQTILYSSISLELSGVKRSQSATSLLKTALLLAWHGLMSDTVILSLVLLRARLSKVSLRQIRVSLSTEAIHSLFLFLHLLTVSGSAQAT